MSNISTFRFVLQQALKDFPHVDSLRKEQKIVFKNCFWEKMSCLLDLSIFLQGT